MISASCAMKVSAFTAYLFVRLLTCFIAIDVELEIIDAQIICKSCFFFVLFSFFFLLLGRFICNSVFLSLQSFILMSLFIL